MKYKQPKAEYVQFQRLVSGVCVLTAVLFQRIEFIHAFLILSLLSFITTMNYSPTTMLFKFIGFVFAQPLFTTAPQYAHSYITNRLAEIFEDLMRLAGGTLILYLYSVDELSAWVVGAFLAIAMLVSSFFGFCLSSLVYIGYKKFMKNIGAQDE